MIHIANGLCFGIVEHNGNILLRKYSNAQCSSIEYEQEITPSTFQSVVSHVIPDHIEQKDTRIAELEAQVASLQEVNKALHESR